MRGTFPARPSSEASPKQESSNKLTTAAERLAFASMGARDRHRSAEQYRPQAVSAYRDFLGEEVVISARARLPREPVPIVDAVFDECLFSAYQSLPEVFVECIVAPAVAGTHWSEINRIIGAISELRESLGDDDNSLHDLIGRLLSRSHLGDWEEHQLGRTTPSNLRVPFLFAQLDSLAQSLADYADHIPRGQGQGKPHQIRLIAELMDLWDSIKPPRKASFTTPVEEGKEPSGPFLEFLNDIVGPLFRPEYPQNFASLIRKARKVRKGLK